MGHTRDALCLHCLRGVPLWGVTGAGGGCCRVGTTGVRRLQNRPWHGGDVGGHQLVHLDAGLD